MLLWNLMPHVPHDSRFSVHVSVLPSFSHWPWSGYQDQTVRVMASAHHSTLIRDASGGRWEWTQRHPRSPTWTRCRQWETLKYSALNGILYFFSYQDSDLCLRSGSKIASSEVVNDWKEMMFSTHNRQIHTWAHRAWQHMEDLLKFKPDKTIAPRMWNRHQWYLLGKREIIFS